MVSLGSACTILDGDMNRASLVMQDAHQATTVRAAAIAPGNLAAGGITKPQ